MLEVTGKPAKKRDMSAKYFVNDKEYTGARGQFLQSHNLRCLEIIQFSSSQIVSCASDFYKFFEESKCRVFEFSSYFGWATGRWNGYFLEALRKDFYYEEWHKTVGKFLRKRIVKEKTGEQKMAIYAQRAEAYRKRTGYTNPSQNPEVRLKIAQTMKERYGVENAMQSKEIFKKARLTRKERYGGYAIWDSKELADKAKATSIERYGVEHPFQSASVREKCKVTSIERYGVEIPAQNASVREKIKTTCLERYGVENPFQVEEVREKIKLHHLERYGVENTFSSPEIKEKIKQYYREKYGVENYTQSVECQKKKRETADQRWKERFGVFDLNDVESILPKEFWRCEINFNMAFCRIGGASGGSCTYFYNRWYASSEKFREFVSSKAYLDLCRDILDSNGFASIAEIELSRRLGATKRRMANNYEVDLYFPDKNIGVELNGYAFHTSIYAPLSVSTPKSKNYHESKTIAAIKSGIKLYHFWYVNSIDPKLPVIESIIKAKLGIYDKVVYARKCLLKKVSLQEANAFHQKYHLLGVPGKIGVSTGLYFNDELVSVLTFSVREKDISVENDRYTIKSGIKIIGGFQKMMAYVIPRFKEKGFKQLISFCDRDLTPAYEDSIYYRYGFKTDGKSFLSLRYFDTRVSQVVSRQTYQKHKLEKLFPASWSPDKTEQQILAENGIYPCYNSGNWKFTLDL